jgi:hypothetical protein
VDADRRQGQTVWRPQVSELLAETANSPLEPTIMGDLLASMFLTLVIVPLFYTLFEDMRESVPWMARSGVSRKVAGRMPHSVGCTDGLLGSSPVTHELNRRFPYLYTRRSSR